MNKIPETWIPPRLISSGFLPDIGVHLRGRTVVLEPSRSVWIGATLMCVIAFMALIPVPKRGFLQIPYFVQIIVSLGFVWGAFCAVSMTYFMHKKYGVSSALDLSSGLMVIQRGNLEIPIPTSRIIGLQILRESLNKGPYQLNLVFQKESGEIAREMLTTQVIRHFVTRLAHRYHELAGIAILEAPVTT